LLALLEGDRWEYIGGFTPWSGCPLCFSYAGSAVDAVLQFDDGSGEALYVGGNFASAGGVPGTTSIARWDGAAWSSVGGGLAGPDPRYTVVKDLVVYDDGTGPALIAVGGFNNAGGAAVSNVAKWDGQNWSPLGAGVAARPGSDKPWVYDAEVFDSGNGPELYVGGYLSTAGGQPVGAIARWNGAQWSGVGGGLWLNANCGTSQPGLAAVLRVYDEDGAGPLPPALYVGGYFQCAGGAPARNFIRWDGQRWSTPEEVAGGTSSGVFGMAEFADGRGAGLYVVGDFRSVGPSGATTPAASVARYGCLDTTIAGDLDCDGRVSFFDIEPFIAALLDAEAYDAAYPTCNRANADVNRDGSVDFFDVDAFIAALFGN
jgi:hypothetical protein